jgi:hypothetical protein
MIPLNRLWQIVVVFLVFQLMQWLKDNFVAPKYIGNVIGLHPVMIFIAIMIGARLDGMLGIIYSLPVACVVNVFITHWAARAAALKKAEETEGLTLTQTDEQNIAIKVAEDGKAEATARATKSDSSAVLSEPTEPLSEPRTQQA